MTGEARGLLDTNIMILRRWIRPDDLPAEMAISSITLAELSAGPHQVRQDADYSYPPRASSVGPSIPYKDEHAERARRLDVLQRAESGFDPIPFGTDAARIYGRVAAAVVAAGRTPRRRIADLMIASVAIAEGLPLFTTNPDDYTGLEELVTVVSVTPHSP